MEIQASVYGPDLSKTWTGIYTKYHHIKLHIYTDDREIANTENCRIQVAEKIQAEVWVFPGGRECPLLPQSSHPVHTIFNRLCPYSMARAGKGLADPADKHQQALPPSLRGPDITGLQQGRLRRLCRRKTQDWNAPTAKAEQAIH